MSGYAENVYRSIVVERKAGRSRSVRLRNVWSSYNGVVVLSRNIPSLLFYLKRATIPRYSTLFYSIPRRPTVSEGRSTLALANRSSCVVAQRLYRIDAYAYHPLIVHLLVRRDRRVETKLFHRIVNCILGGSGEIMGKG